MGSAAEAQEGQVTSVTVLGWGAGKSGERPGPSETKPSGWEDLQGFCRREAEGGITGNDLGDALQG